MSDTIRVLIVEDDPVDADLILRELKRGGFNPLAVRVDTEQDYLAELEKSPDIVLADSKLPLFDGLEALELLKQRKVDIPFILISGRLGEDIAVDAIKRGACDYLLKDRMARLGEAVRRAIDDRRLRAENVWAADALRKSEERYRLVSETTSDYVYSLLVDPDGSFHCEWITEPFQRITGFNTNEINRNGWITLYHPDDRAIVSRHQERLRAGEPHSMDVRVVTKHNGLRWMRVSERPEKFDSRIYGSAQDITAQRQLEEQLVQSQKMEAIGQLAGGIAHDFNNLLTVICGYGDLMKKLPNLSPDAREFTDEILQAARRAAQLTKQLLAFGRRQIMAPKVVDINSTLGDLESLLRRLIGEHIELVISRRANPAFVKIDSGQIGQALMNLVVNSRDAMPRGGTLTIETENVEINRDTGLETPAPGGGSHVVISVTDTGTGMDADTAARVFEPFFTTKEPGKGTGLGLAMTYGIVTQSGGEIRMTTEEGSGTTFRIFLPRVQPEPEAPSEPVPFHLERSHGTVTILVLEDEDLVRTMMREVLTREGHHVLDTGNPGEAIEICRRHPGNIDLFITDLVLPGMNGVAVAEQLARMRPEMRIAYTSGYAGDAQLSVKMDGASFFEKPFTAEALLENVRAVLDGDGL